MIINTVLNFNIILNFKLKIKFKYILNIYSILLKTKILINWIEIINIIVFIFNFGIFFFDAYKNSAMIYNILYIFHIWYKYYLHSHSVSLKRLELTVHLHNLHRYKERGMFCEQSISLK